VSPVRFSETGSRVSARSSQPPRRGATHRAQSGRPAPVSPRRPLGSRPLVQDFRSVSPTSSVASAFFPVIARAPLGALSFLSGRFCAATSSRRCCNTLLGGGSHPQRSGSSGSRSRLSRAHVQQAHPEDRPMAPGDDASHPPKDREQHRRSAKPASSTPQGTPNFFAVQSLGAGNVRSRDIVVDGLVDRRSRNASNAFHWFRP